MNISQLDRSCLVNDTLDGHGLPLTISLPFATVFLGVAIAGISGNILVILSICLCGHMRSAMNFVLLNMAFADAGNLISCAPEMAQILLNWDWVFPDFFCPIIRYLQIGFLYSSVGFQLAVSLERCVAIKYPLRSRLICTKGKVTWSIVFIWLFSGVFAFPYALHEVYQTDMDCPVYICAPKDPEMFGMTSSFKMVEFLVYYLVAMLIIICVYGVILHELFRVKLVKTRRSSATHGQRAKRRVVTMLLTSVVVYFISYSPVQMFFLTNRFIGHYEPGPITILVCNALMWANSAINPLIYSVFSTKFRTQFRLLLGCQVDHDRLSRQPNNLKRPMTSSVVRCHSQQSMTPFQ